MSQAGRTLWLLLAANLFWSTGGWLIKEIDVAGPALAGWRSLIAFLFLLALRPLLGSGRGHPPPAAAWRGRGLWLGAASFALNTICFVTATKLTTAANAILLQYTAPVYVLLFGALWLKEPVRRADLAAVALAFGGLALLLSERLGGGSGAGNLLALAAGLSFAGTILALRHEAGRDPLRVPLLGCGLAALALAPWWIGQPPPPGQWPHLLGLGVGQFGLGYLCYALGMRRARAATGALAAAVEPVLNPVWVALLLHEVPGPRALAGGLLVLAAVTGRGWWAARRGE
ncbi:MAG: DMT family transporter [bacterium]|jgi:drug/metabolite transporter (DMT)-like permease|nr:DMT family transporter [bacterium]